jgi:hypothetical protein
VILEENTFRKTGLSGPVLLLLGLLRGHVNHHQEGMGIAVLERLRATALELPGQLLHGEGLQSLDAAIYLTRHSHMVKH